MPVRQDKSLREYLARYLNMNRFERNRALFRHKSQAQDGDLADVAVAMIDTSGKSKKKRASETFEFEVLFLKHNFNEEDQAKRVD